MWKKGAYAVRWNPDQQQRAGVWHLALITDGIPSHNTLTDFHPARSKTF
jgi:hypothetical protein